MDQKKLTEALSDKAFVEKIVKLQTPEEVQTAFKEKGIEISVEDVQLLGSVINKMIEKGSTELSEKDMENIAGGGDSKVGDFWQGFKGPIQTAASRLISGENPSSSAGVLTSYAATIAATAGVIYAVPWAYKKIKDAVNSRRNKK